VKWLNFFEDLVVEDDASKALAAAERKPSIIYSGLAFRREYQLDGTHASPNYVSLIEKSLNACL
jgi:hypothetical protein